MSRDLSEYIDDYCSDTYGHTNWGFKSAYTEDFLNENKHDNEGHFVFFHEEHFDEDEHCMDTYGHTNWGHKDDFSTKFLSENEHEIKNNIVFFEEDFDLNKSEVK